MRPGSTGGGNGGSSMGGGNGGGTIGGGGNGGGMSQGNSGGGERADNGRGGGPGGMRGGGMSLRARKKGFAGVAVYVAMATSEDDVMVTTEVVAMVTLLEFEVVFVWDCVTILTFSSRPHSWIPCMSLMV